jgi:hypothetical protein
MKTKSIAKLIAIFLGGLTLAGGSVSRGQTARRVERLSVSKYGTLLEISDANGKSRFGKLAGEGFQISYEVNGKTTSVSAVGDWEQVNLTVGDVKTGREATTVTTKSSDQALEITTYYFVNKKMNRLIIQRKFKNISNEPVVVKAMSEYIDPALVSGVQRDLKEMGDKLLAVLKSKLKAAVGGDCEPGECPEDPPPCPLPCGMRIKFDVDRMSIRPNPTGDGRASLVLPADSAMTLPVNGEVVQHLFLAFP